MDHIRLTDPPQEPEQGAGPPESEKQEDESGQLQASEPDLTYKNGAEVARGGVLGFFIGLAVIVPGVSGSTVAIIFRLYDKLLYALGNIFRRFKKCAKFLLPIVLGLAVGFVLGIAACWNQAA